MTQQPIILRAIFSAKNFPLCFFLLFLACHAQFTPTSDQERNSSERMSSGTFVLRQRIPSDWLGLYVKAVGGKSIKVAAALPTSLRLHFLPNPLSHSKRTQMNSNTLALLTGFLLNYSSCSFINVDTSLDPELLTQNQVFLNRKEKFIKFDTKDNNLEIELGISIPFIKVPLAASKHLSDAKDSKITINAPGLLVAGMLMLTSFLVVPLLFATTPDQGFGFQRKGKSAVWSFVDEVNEALSRSGIDASSCMGRSICWLAKASKGGEEGSIGDWVNHIVKSWWLNRFIAGTMIEDAVQVGSNGSSCGAVYSDCSLTKKHLQSFGKMVAARHY